MLKSFTAFLLISFPLWVMGQNLELLTKLNSQINESSGLIYLDGRLITHNDSQGEAMLYELDSLTGNVVRQVEILNAVNTDWEDICYDEQYIYIGDFGNNNGNRTDLKIYRVSRQAYLENDAVTAEVISFNYSDQTDFSNASPNAEFDAEALIALGDSLYIFTKDWANLRTVVYPIPKVPGEYQLIKTDSLDIDGLATGATVCSETGRILLSAYTILQPFIVSISEYEGNAFSQGSVQIINVQTPTGYSYQIEGIAAISHQLVYLTAEENILGDAALYKLGFNPTSIREIEHELIVIHPNPTSDYFQISTDQSVIAHIYNAVGQKVKTIHSKQVDVSDLPVGSYIIEICESSGQILSTQKLMIRR